MTTVRAVSSPCIGICTLDPAGYCDGCFRSGEEIGDWLSMADPQRQYMMDVVLPARETHLLETRLFEARLFEARLLEARLFEIKPLQDAPV